MTSSLDLFHSECKFVIGAASLEQIPNGLYMPEVAFIGRSNVGKSSLINAIVGKRDCARVSKSPGRTQQINFFSLQNKIFLVDLPGYGYAAVSKKTRKSWDGLIEDYIRSRQNLRRVFLLIDSRRGIKASDEEIMEMMDDSGVTYQIVLTKIDELKSTTEMMAQIESQISVHPAAFPRVISTSSEKKLGLRNIQMEIVSFLHNRRS